jgi:hypothetical protein
MTHMEPLDNGYRLTAVQEKGYYGPVPAHMLPEAAQQSVSPWYLLPHHQRQLTHSQKHTVDADITEFEDGWKLRVRSDEPAEVMTQISLVFGGEGEFIADGLKPAGENASFWTGGAVRYITDRDWLEVTGGDHEHLASSVRGASYPAGCRTLLVNVMTPFEKEIFIRLSPADIDS